MPIDPNVSTDTNMLEWAFKGCVTVLFTIGGWLWIMLVKAVSKNQDALNATQDRLDEHKLDIAKNFVSKSDFSFTMSQINETVKRIHDRLDNLFDIQRNGK